MPRFCRCRLSYKPHEPPRAFRPRSLNRNAAALRRESRKRQLESKDLIKARGGILVQLPLAEALGLAIMGLGLLAAGIWSAYQNAIPTTSALWVSSMVMAPLLLGGFVSIKASCGTTMPFTLVEASGLLALGILSHFDSMDAKANVVFGLVMAPLFAACLVVVNSPASQANRGETTKNVFSALLVGILALRARQRLQAAAATEMDGHAFFVECGAPVMLCVVSAVSLALAAVGYCSRWAAVHYVLLITGVIVIGSSTLIRFLTNGEGASYIPMRCDSYPLSIMWGCLALYCSWWLTDNNAAWLIHATQPRFRS